MGQGKAKLRTEAEATRLMRRLGEELSTLLRRYPEVHVASVYACGIAEGSGDDVATMTHCEGNSRILANMLVSAFPSLRGVHAEEDETPAATVAVAQGARRDN